MNVENCSVIAVFPTETLPFGAAAFGSGPRRLFFFTSTLPNSLVTSGFKIRNCSLVSVLIGGGHLRRRTNPAADVLPRCGLAILSKHLRLALIEDQIFRSNRKLALRGHELVQVALGG